MKGKSDLAVAVSPEVSRQVIRGIAAMERLWQQWIDAEDYENDPEKGEQYIAAFLDSEEVKNVISHLSELAPDIQKTDSDGRPKASYDLATFAARAFVAGMQGAWATMGSRGGKGRARKLSPKARSKSARRAARARWSKS